MTSDERPMPDHPSRRDDPEATRAIIQSHPFIFRCPNCSRRLRASAEKAGKQIVCPVCTAGFVAPPALKDIASADSPSLILPQIDHGAEHESQRETESALNTGSTWSPLISMHPGSKHCPISRAADGVSPVVIVLAYVFAIIFSPVGLVLGIMGMSKGSDVQKGHAIAAIVISIISFVIGVAIVARF